MERITYTCAGPKLLLSRADLNKRIDSLFAQIGAGTAIISEDQKARLHDTRDEGLPNTFEIGGTFGLDADGNGFVRQPCGQDVTDLIEAVPVDGEVHEVACPKCATVATVRRMPAEDLEDQADTES